MIPLKSTFIWSDNDNNIHDNTEHAEIINMTEIQMKIHNHDERINVTITVIEMKMILKSSPKISTTISRHLYLTISYISCNFMIKS